MKQFVSFYQDNSLKDKITPEEKANDFMKKYPQYVPEYFQYIKTDFGRKLIILFDIGVKDEAEFLL